MASRKKPILVLTDVCEDSADGAILDAAWIRKTWDRTTERDVIPALERLGFEVVTVGSYRRLDRLMQRIAEIQPRAIFNLTEAFHNVRSNDFKLTAVLDLLGIPYTGCRTEGLSICRDKVLTKLVLQRSGVLTPRFLLGAELERKKAFDFPFPAILKPRFGDSSEGMSKDSLVPDAGKAMARTRVIRRRFRCDSMIEEFVPGREIYVSLAEVRGRPMLLGRGEVLFGRLPPPHFVSHHLKWNETYRKKWKIKFGAADDLSASVQQEIRDMAPVAWEALRLSGAARLDCRLSQDGRLFVLECNPNPSLAKKDGFSLAAKAAGLSYDQLILALLRSSISMSSGELRRSRR
jgi:D-alanine-D-alanine ligase